MFRTIRFRYTLAYSLMVIGVVVLLFTIYLVIGSSLFLSKQYESEFNLVYAYAGDISQSIDNHRSVLSNEASRIPFDLKDPEEIVRNLRIMSESDDYYFINVSYTNTDGITLSSNRAMLNYDNELLKEDFDDYVISGPYLEVSTKLTMILISVPIYSDGVYMGKITGYLNSNLLLSDFKDIPLWQDSRAWIFNTNGKILSNSETTLHEISDLKELKFDIYEVVEENVYFEGYHEFEESGIVDYTDSKTDINWFVTYTPILGSPDWNIAVTSLQKYFLLELEEYALFMIIVTLFILSITLVITVVLTNNTVKPIVHLTKAAKCKELVSLSKGIEKRKDEITTLYNSFNTMTESLVTYSESLEELVEERTRELNETNERLYSLATTDNLTGAMNRMQIIDKIETLIYNIKSVKNISFSILFIDLNNFKYYNDTFGHDIGDLLLIEVIDFLSSQIRANDFFGRYGGDEFIVVYPNMTIEVVPQVVGKLLSAFKVRCGFESELTEWTEAEVDIPEYKELGLAIGTATYVSGSNETVDSLIKRADEDMYKMKVLSKKRSE